MSKESAGGSDNVAHQSWQVARHKALAGPDSWLGLIGLFWLEVGSNALGSADECAIKLPDGPAHQGNVVWQADQLFWQPATGNPLALLTDRFGSPSTVDLGNYVFFVVEREGRLALRLCDKHWASHQSFSGVSCYPYDPDWRIEATWEVLSPPLKREVSNVTGDLKPIELSHQALFEVGGQRVVLLPMSIGEQEVLFVFRDQTSGKETYGAGRFLNAPAAVDDKIILDFNFATNPPCAFTPFATCPLPPPENWLHFPVRAGEKKWESGE